ncbi:MAG: tRNA (adenosine(37)-N6)-threonylcarbamoyltransferase complex transferase subunit TsaD, partial [Ruminococcus sp.]|nr:tRNA (adenosine(37)-N6)-threonylcarbamoyltransferase complex transferase subunit TsaD [Ruminococcus sp.]
AKGFALATGKPLIPVHHLRSHIASYYISNTELKPPFLCLVVSGGHSHIVEVRDYTDMKVIGRTRDDAAGEAFDKAARAMGIPYPGGVELDKIAESGDENAFPMPRPRVDGSPYDFSFSGLKTAVINLIHNKQQKGEEVNVSDVCASYRRAVVNCLADNFLLAAEDLGYTKLVIAGGVSANSLLRRELSKRCEGKYQLFMPEKYLCGDNGAMVGAQAYYEYLAGHIAKTDLNAVATLPISENLF